MTVSEEIKTIDKKIELQKSHFYFIIENVGKYEFPTDVDVLMEKYLFERVATIKRFEYSPLRSELRKQTDIP